jgi:hypothetical protein
MQLSVELSWSKKEIVSNGKLMKQQFLVYFILEVLIGSKRFYS